RAVPPGRPSRGVTMTRPPARGLLLVRMSACFVVLVVAGGALLWPARKVGPTPCRDTFRQVRAGVDLAEAAAAVGGPPGDSSADGVTIRMPDRRWLTAAGQIVSWQSDDAVLYLEIDETTGRVVGAEVIDGFPTTGPPWWQRAYRWLGL